MNMQYEKVIGWLAGVLVLGILLWGFLSSMENKAPAVAIPEQTEEIPAVPAPQPLIEYLKADFISVAGIADWKVFSNEAFSIKHPKDFSVNPNYTNETNGPDQIQSGVSFSIPTSLTKGTNLSRDTQISVEEHSQATTSCEATSFISKDLADNSEQHDVMLNGAKYTFVMTGDAGAGNFYEQYILAIPGPTCHAIRLFIHSTNIGNYDPGTVKEFDKQALLSIFATMAASYDAK